MPFRNALDLVEELGYLPMSRQLRSALFQLINLYTSTGH